MSNNYLPTTYQEFIHLSRYSRWLPEEKRRETWNETISRYFNFFDEHLNDMHKYKIPKTNMNDFANIVKGSYNFFMDLPKIDKRRTEKKFNDLNKKNED